MNKRIAGLAILLAMGAQAAPDKPHVVVVLADDMGYGDVGAVGGGKGHRSGGKLKGQKTSLFEGGHRVPLIVRWPAAVEAGRVNETPLCLSGLLATMAEMFGVELPVDVGEDSVSFLPNLKDDPYEKTNLYGQNPERVERLSQTLEKYKSTNRSR